MLMSTFKIKRVLLRPDLGLFKYTIVSQICCLSQSIYTDTISQALDHFYSFPNLSFASRDNNLLQYRLVAKQKANYINYLHVKHGHNTAIISKYRKQIKAVDKHLWNGDFHKS